MKPEQTTRAGRGPDGALYFTDPPFGLPGSFDDPAKEVSFQGVYRLSADGKLSLLTKELDAPNGIGFSPDGRRCTWPTR